MMNLSLGLLVMKCPWDALLALSDRQESQEGSGPAWTCGLGCCQFIGVLRE